MLDWIKGNEQIAQATGAVITLTLEALTSNVMLQMTPSC